MPKCKLCEKEIEEEGVCFVRGGRGENVAPCHIFKQRRFCPEASMIKMRVPLRLSKKRLENYDNNKIVNYLWDLADGETMPRTILFTGTVGCGKTHLAIGTMYRYSLKISESVKMYSFYDIMADIYKTLDPKSSKEAREVVNYFSEIGVLLIDDLGAHKSTDYTLTNLFEIVNRRYENGKLTIITTNLSGEALVEAVGQRITDRISNGEVIVMKGPSGRKSEQNIVEFDV